MKRIVMVALFLFAVFAVVEAKSKDEELYNYELSISEENTSAASGFKVFKVWSYGKKKELLTKEVCMKNAVHGMLFKGLAGGDSGTQGYVPAIVPDGYDSNKKYFDKFFSSGDYAQYIQLSNKGAIQAGDCIKITRKQYKVGMLVQVNYSALRKRMETDNIISSASNLFSYPGKKKK